MVPKVYNRKWIFLNMDTGILVNIHKSYRQVVAICDKNLLGLKLENDTMQLDMGGNFFNGKEVSEEELLNLLKEYSYEDATFYIVGKSSVDYAKENGLINEKGIKKINDVPFALVLL